MTAIAYGASTVKRDRRTNAEMAILDEDRWDVPLGILRGDSSETFVYNVAADLDPDRINVFAQLGDHDPSGVGAWENFCAKLTAFADPAIVIEFERLAVTPEQIVELNLPTRPTKQSNRSKNWTGGNSAEVDGIPAPELRRIVDEWIASYVDQRQCRILREAEEQERELLHMFARGAA